MFGSKESNKKIDSTVTGTVIGEGIKIENGIIKGQGSIRVDGEIMSEVDIKGNIIIGETGRITGNINTVNSLIAGKIDGNVTSEQTMHLTSTAVVNGSISSAVLIVDEGARFTGNCQMAQESNSPKPNKQRPEK